MLDVEFFSLPFVINNPFYISAPHPLAQRAAEELLRDMRHYMAQHPESELHRRGKMFGVLIAEDGEVLRAFSAMLDGSYHHPGFVPPVVDISRPDGYFKQEEARISAMGATPERKVRSQALQRWLFTEYKLLNVKGEERNLLELFANEKPIQTEEEFFSKSAAEPLSKSAAEAVQNSSQKPFTTYNLQLTTSNVQLTSKGIPSGAGECCAPKLLQAAYQQGLKPLYMAEFWVGASPKNEVREEGRFYPACSSRCKPILRHMLQGLEVEDGPHKLHNEGSPLCVKILFEDDALLVVNKPAGLLSAPGKDGDEPWVGDVLALEANCPINVLPVHRLDQDTSGLLVLAKTPEAYKLLQKQFLRRDINKRYEAILEHAPKQSQQPITPLLQPTQSPTPPQQPIQSVQEPHDIPSQNALPLTTYHLPLISLPLLPDPFDRPRQMVNLEHGKSAETRWALREERPDGTCLVDFWPLTGRTHQLRVHAAHHLGLGAPIKGDRLYGSAADRLYLHAAELTFTHPLTGAEMHFDCPSGF